MLYTVERVHMPTKMNFCWQCIIFKTLFTQILILTYFNHNTPIFIQIKMRKKICSKICILVDENFSSRASCTILAPARHEKKSRIKSRPLNFKD